MDKHCARVIADRAGTRRNTSTAGLSKFAVEGYTQMKLLAEIGLKIMAR